MNESKTYIEKLKSTGMKRPLNAGLQSKKVFVFDWDGTILDSMPMKSKNFVQAFKAIFPENAAIGSDNDVADHYLRLSGHPRKYIFFSLLSLFKINPDLIFYDRFNSEFESLNRQNLISANVFSDAIDLLRALIQEGHQIFISSSVPPKELSDLVGKILPPSILEYITSILGSSDGFAKGIDHLQWILDKTGAAREQILVVGDDIADYELSSQAGIDCILVDRKCKLIESQIYTIGDLYQLKKDIQK